MKDDTVPRPSTREQLIESASRLFYRFGYQAVGVDRIADDSGVSKMTMYRHFPSKDDLIMEHLRRSANEFWEWFDAAAGVSEEPKGKLLAIFDALGDRCRSAQCTGCTFQAAAAEFPDRNHPAHKIAREHKQELRGRLESLTQAAGLKASDDVANRLMLIMEGALASVRLLSLPVPAREAAEAARAVLAEA